MYDIIYYVYLYLGGVYTLGILDRIINLFQGYNWLIIPAAFFAVVFHEVSHGFVAYCLGDKTAKARGRLSINPLNHIDFFGLICMIVFGFGWAKPVPINPYYFKNRKLGIVLVSLAGPVSNLMQALIAITAALLISQIDAELAILEILVQFFVILGVLNTSLAIFNLLPIPPLDGSKILFSVLPNKCYSFVLQYERYGFLILFVLLNISFVSDFLCFLQQTVFGVMFNFVANILF